MTQVQQTVSLKDWIDKEGISTVAKVLTVTEACVRHWKRGYVLPDSNQMKKIRMLTKGRVSFDTTLDSHFSKENKKNRFKP